MLSADQIEELRACARRVDAISETVDADGAAEELYRDLSATESGLRDIADTEEAEATRLAEFIKANKH